MANRKIILPQYGTVMKRGVLYYRTRIKDANGKLVAIYAKTPEELYNKETLALEQIENATFHRKTPTVAEYCEKWLLMQSEKVSASTLRGYTRDMINYIIKPLGEMYMEEVTADDIRLALVSLSKKSEGLYNKVNMLLKCIFYAAERRSTNSMNITYTQSGDYLIPNIIIRKTKPLGHYGRLRKAYLKMHRPILFNELALSDKIFEHCAEIGEAARSRMELIVPELAKQYGVTEQLKAENQMEWVRQRNACKAQAEEVVKAELIYN